MENKKNTILLTVIAVATLLVAVVGATFAYFTAQGGSASQADVVVNTGKAGSSSLGTFKAINIYADASNFAQGKGDQTGTSTGTVSWTAPTNATGSTTGVTEADRTMCYTATLAITNNTFVVSKANTTSAAELEFTAVKGSKTIIDKMNITTTKTNVQIPTTTGGTDYTHKLVADAGATVSDSWTLTVTLKNLGVDQNDNTGKNFEGAVKFDKTSCK